MSTEVEILKANLRDAAEAGRVLAKQLFEAERERDRLQGINTQLLETLKDVQLCGYHLDDEAMSKVDDAVAAA